MIWANWSTICLFGAVFFAHGLGKACPCLRVYPSCVCFCVHVCVYLGTFGWGGSSRVCLGEAVGCGPRSPSPRKQKPELQPLKTMRGTRETLAHGGLGYLLALPHLDLSGPRSKSRPTQCDTCTAPPALCFGNSLHSPRDSSASNARHFPSTCVGSPVQSSSWLTMF